MLVTLVLLRVDFHPCLFRSVACAWIEISSSPIFLFQPMTNGSCNSHAMSELKFTYFLKNPKPFGYI